MDQRVLLRIRWIGLAGPADDLAGSRIEDGHQLRVRTRLRAGGTTAMIVSYPVLLVPLDVQVNSKRQESRSLSRQVQHVAAYHRLDRFFSTRNQLAEVARLGVPSPTAVIITGQPRGWFVSSAVQSGNLERKPCSTAAISYFRSSRG